MGMYRGYRGFRGTYKECTTSLVQGSYEFYGGIASGMIRISNICATKPPLELRRSSSDLARHFRDLGVATWCRVYGVVMIMWWMTKLVMMMMAALFLAWHGQGFSV